MIENGDKLMSIDTTANNAGTGTDELDRLALEECVKRLRLDRRVSILIMPAPRCELVRQFVNFGAQVTLSDTPDRRQDVEGRILASGLRDDVRFVSATLPELPDHPDGEPYDIIIMHRGLCGMPYDEGRQVVRKLMQKLRIGGKFYVSILGLHSELGEDYPDAEVDVSERYAELARHNAEKYRIHGKVCLYTERNLFMLLLEAGASVLRTMTTTYGNVKGVAVRV
jgi:hypothetical protein